MRGDPQLDEQLVSCRTDKRHDAVLIEVTRVDEIIHHAAGVILDFAALAGTSGIDDHVRGRGRIVLQLDTEVIEPGFLVVARDIRKLVKLLIAHLREGNRDCAVSRALEIVATHRKRRADSLAAESRRIDLDRVGALSRDDRSR